MEAFEKVKPYFESISPNVMHCGDVGNGHVVKLVNNTIAAVNRIGMLEAVAMEPTALFRSEEHYYRAALLAADVVEDQERVWGHKVGTFQRSLALARHAVQELEARGLLVGTMPVERIAEVMLGAFRSACHDWARRLITIDEFERRALTAVFLTAAADAKPELRTRLTERLASLDTTIRPTTAAPS